jgi:V-type H+-transporting ATPase subunit C
VLKDPYVKPKDFIYSDYLTTVVAIVSKNQVPDFLACYELLTENVLPKSAKQFQIEDKDNLTAWRVVLMKTDLDAHLHREEEVIEEQYRKKKLSPVDEFIVRARDKLKYI